MLYSSPCTLSLMIIMLGSASEDSLARWEQDCLIHLLHDMFLKLMILIIKCYWNHDVFSTVIFAQLYF